MHTDIVFGDHVLLYGEAEDTNADDVHHKALQRSFLKLLKAERTQGTLFSRFGGAATNGVDCVIVTCVVIVIVLNNNTT